MAGDIDQNAFVWPLPKPTVTAAHAYVEARQKSPVRWGSHTVGERKLATARAAITDGFSAFELVSRNEAARRENPDLAGSGHLHTLAIEALQAETLNNGIAWMDLIYSMLKIAKETYFALKTLRDSIGPKVFYLDRTVEDAKAEYDRLQAFAHRTQQTLDPLARNYQFWVQQSNQFGLSAPASVGGTNGSQEAYARRAFLAAIEHLDARAINSAPDTAARLLKAGTSAFTVYHNSTDKPCYAKASRLARVTQMVADSRRGPFTFRHSRPGFLPQAVSVIRGGCSESDIRRLEAYAKKQGEHADFVEAAERSTTAAFGAAPALIIALEECLLHSTGAGFGLEEHRLRVAAQCALEDLRGGKVPPSQVARQLKAEARKRTSLPWYVLTGCGWVNSGWTFGPLWKAADTIDSQLWADEAPNKQVERQKEQFKHIKAQVMQFDVTGNFWLTNLALNYREFPDSRDRAVQAKALTEAQRVLALAKAQQTEYTETIDDVLEALNPGDVAAGAVAGADRPLMERFEKVLDARPDNGYLCAQMEYLEAVKQLAALTTKEAQLRRDDAPEYATLSAELTAALNGLASGLNVIDVTRRARNIAFQIEHKPMIAGLRETITRLGGDISARLLARLDATLTSGNEAAIVTETITAITAEARAEIQRRAAPAIVAGAHALDPSQAAAPRVGEDGAALA